MKTQLDYILEAAARLNTPEPVSFRWPRRLRRKPAQPMRKRIEVTNRNILKKLSANFERYGTPFPNGAYR